MGLVIIMIVGVGNLLVSLLICAIGANGGFDFNSRLDSIMFNIGIITLVSGSICFVLPFLYLLITGLTNGN